MYVYAYTIAGGIYILIAYIHIKFSETIIFHNPRLVYVRN